MPPPIPRCSNWAYPSLNSPSCFSLPRYGSRVGLHIFLFEACSTFTRVAACTLALSPIRDTLIEGFSHFVTSMTAPIASGWSGCRVGLTPTGKRRLCTAHARTEVDHLVCAGEQITTSHFVIEGERPATASRTGLIVTEWGRSGCRGHNSSSRMDTRCVARPQRPALRPRALRNRTARHLATATGHGAHRRPVWADHDHLVRHHRRARHCRHRPTPGRTCSARSPGRALLSFRTRLYRVSCARRRQRLNDLGWVEGGNLQILYRWTGNDPERTQRCVSELVALAPEVILSQSPPHADSRWSAFCRRRFVNAN